MKPQYFVSMFFLCFFVWVILVDNVPVPGLTNLKQDVGTYSRYRVKEWKEVGDLDLVKDELLVYAVVDNREQLYYIDYKPHFETTLKNLPPGTRVQMRYVNRFPKFWKRHLYDMRDEGHSFMCYSQFSLVEKRRAVAKYSWIIGGVFLFLVALGFINQSRTK